MKTDVKKAVSAAINPLEIFSNMIKGGKVYGGKRLSELMDAGLKQYTGFQLTGALPKFIEGRLIEFIDEDVAIGFYVDGCEWIESAAMKQDLSHLLKFGMGAANGNGQ